MAKSKSNKADIEIKANIGDPEKWKEWSKECGKNSRGAQHGTAGALYFVGFIGSMVYWMQAATNFGAVITGFLKSTVWPAYIVYKLLEGFYGVVN